MRKERESSEKRKTGEVREGRECEGSDSEAGRERGRACFTARAVRRTEMILCGMAWLESWENNSQQFLAVPRVVI